MDLWGIDLGGTKIEGAILDPEQCGKASFRLRIPTEAGKGYEHILGQIARLVTLLESESGTCRPSRIGIGTPGATEPSTGLLKNSNTTCLNARPLKRDLESLLGTRVCMANDANCFALAEATLGAAKNEELVFGVILGTGVGGGLVIHGRALEGTHAIAGEWGHNPLPGEETPCYCGRRRCIETVISGPALERFYQARSGQTLRLRQIEERAAAGDSAAGETLQRLQDKFGQALASVLNIFDPSAVVIGGGVGNLGLLYSGATRAAILAHLFNRELRTRILKPELGDSAGVFGAAMLTRDGC